MARPKKAPAVPWPSPLLSLEDVQKANAGALAVLVDQARAEALSVAVRHLRHLQQTIEGEVKHATTEGRESALRECMNDLGDLAYRLERASGADGWKYREPVSALAEIERASIAHALENAGHTGAAAFLRARGLDGHHEVPLTRAVDLAKAVADKSEVRDRSFDDVRQVGEALATNLARMAPHTWADALALTLARAKRAGASGAPLEEAELPTVEPRAVSPEVACLLRVLKAIVPHVSQGFGQASLPWLLWADVVRALEGVEKGGR
jgi:hypothetical protein